MELSSRGQTLHIQGPESDLWHCPKDKNKEEAAFSGSHGVGAIFPDSEPLSNGEGAIL